ncbi:MAG: c-type cytochrome [Ramlibacter sp.]|nr:c-type cytochrome [Ramlibacter sp.]
MTTWRQLAVAAALLSLGCMAGLPACAQVRKPAAAVSAASTARAAGTADAVVYAERFRTVCAACHGVDGRSDMAGTPVLAGQHSLYAITQLFLFREGRRDNPAMTALAMQMKDADLRGFSDYIGTLPPVPAPAPAALPDAARMNKGQALAKEYKCVFCHGADLDGGQGVPRIGGQKEDYVRATLQGFKSGARPAYTRAMTEALSQVPEQDLALLAYYVANFTGK